MTDSEGFGGEFSKIQAFALKIKDCNLDFSPLKGRDDLAETLTHGEPQLPG